MILTKNGPQGLICPHPGANIHVYLHNIQTWKIHEKIFFSKTTTAKASIFGMQHSYVKIYINPVKHAPGVRNGPTLGDQ